MSIKLQFDKGSLSTRVILNDDALPALMEIVSKHQSDEGSPVPGQVLQTLPILPDLDDPTKQQSRIDFARSWLRRHSVAEALSKIGWPNLPEKIVILGGMIEAKAMERTTAVIAWRNADIDAAFASARLDPPGNFARDISNAIRMGIIATVTPRTYCVSRTGWLKLYDGIILATVKEQEGEGSKA